METDDDYEATLIYEAARLKAAHDLAQEELRQKIGYAIQCRSVKDVRVLAQQGAPLLAEFELEHPQEKGNALDLAMYYHRPELAFELLKFYSSQKAPANAPPLDLSRLAATSRRAVVWAARDGRAELLRLLLESKGDVAQRDIEGRSALHVATLRGCVDCVTALLNKGAWSREPDRDQVRRWALHWHLSTAFEAADIGIGAAQPTRQAQQSWERWSPQGASPEGGPHGGAAELRPVPSVPDTSDPLQLANLQIAQSQVEACAPSPARLSNNPLELLQIQEALRGQLLTAIRNENPVDIELLVQRGASLLPHYHSERMLSVVEEGEEYQGSWSSKGPWAALVNPVDWAALEGHFGAALQLLELGDGKVVFDRDEHQSTLTRLELARGSRKAVYCAAFRGQLKLLTALLERNGDPGQTNARGESALFVAVREDHPEAAEALLSFGAWEMEDRKHEVLERAKLRRMACVFDAAGVNATPGDSIGGLASEPPPPWEDMVRHLCESPLQSDKTFRVDRFLEQTRSQEQSRRRWDRDQSPTNRGSSSARAATAEDEYADAPEPHTLSDLRSACVMFNTELTIAIKKGDLKCISSLVRQGAPLDGAFDLGYGEHGNCIDWACVSKQPAVALLLLQLAESTWPELAGDLAVGARAALFWSVLEGYLEVLRALLRRGADPSQRTTGGDSVLSLAISSWREQEAVELLRYGAWNSEPEESRIALLTQAQLRKPVADALRGAGLEICGVVESRRRSLGLAEGPSATEQASANLALMTAVR